MNRFIQRVMIGFVAVFGVSVAAIIAYAVFWQMPQQQCERHGAWWDPADRICATPIFLPNITHRPIGSPKLKPGEVQMLDLKPHAPSPKPA